MNVDPRLVRSDSVVQEQQQMEQQIAHLESVVKSVMTADARSRFTNVKLVSDERALQALLALAQMMQSGKMQVVDDQVLKSVLASMPQKQVRIRR